MNRKRFRAQDYITALVITMLVFLIGVLLGNYVSSIKLNSLTGLGKELELQTLGTQIKFDLLTESFTCDNESLESNVQLTAELRDLGNKLTYMESKLGQDDPNVLMIKEYYHLLEIQHWRYTKQLKEKCNQTYNTVLFFYAKTKDCPNCEDQGEILTYAHKEYLSFNTYSFDIGIDNPALNTLKDMYGVETAPTVVVNGKTYEGFKDKDALLAILSEHKII